MYFEEVARLRIEIPYPNNNMTISCSTRIHLAIMPGGKDTGLQGPWCILLVSPRQSTAKPHKYEAWFPVTLPATTRLFLPKQISTD